jgi:hypothetical protein
MPPDSSLLSPHSFWLRLCRAMEFPQIRVTRVALRGTDEVLVKNDHALNSILT